MELNDSLAAVVTGGGSGLGAATARALANEGVKVAILDMNEEAGKANAEEIGGVFAKCDVADPASVTAALETVRGAHGQERICVNCAGIAPAAKTVSRGQAHDPELYLTTLKVNLFGTFNVASQSALGMANAEALNDDGEHGVIINTASVAAYDGQIGQVAYSATKGGVVGMCLPMARDLAKNGIRVMTIAPGIFETPMLMGMPDEVRESLGAMVPFPSRLGKAKEYARLALEICRNHMLNGEVIRLDGAIRMAPR